MNRLLGYAAFVLVALLLGLACTAPTPFFADLPLSVAAIHSGKMHIQFPGYVPFHLLIAALGNPADLTNAFVAVSLVCGLISLVYIMLTAELLAGTTAAWLAGAVAGCGLLNVYFSAVGSSYITDMLAVAGTLHHGLKAMSRTGHGKHLLWAAFWCGIGIALRPLSAMWIMPAAIYLAWKWGTPRERLGAAVVLGVMLTATSLVSLHYYGSVANVLDSMGSVKTAAAAGMNKNTLISTVVRLAGFPIYFFHAWLALAAIAAYAASRTRQASPFEKQAAVFMGLIAAPYCLVLIRHIPQGGYLCYLAPIIIVAPFTFQRYVTEHPQLYRNTTIMFVMVALVQMFALRPVAPKTMAGAVADAYFLQYSRAGIQTNMFETLASIALKNDIGTDKVPQRRKEEILEEQSRKQK